MNPVAAPADINPRDWLGYLGYCRYCRTVDVPPPDYETWVAIRDVAPTDISSKR